MAKSLTHCALFRAATAHCAAAGKARFRAALAVLLAAWPGEIAAAECPLQPGAVVVSTQEIAGASVPQIAVRAVIDAEATRVWRVIDDCNGYVRSMPRVIAAKELSRVAGKSQCQVTVHMPFPFSNLVGVTEAESSVQPGRWRRVFRHLSGDYAKNDGQWRLSPCGATLARTLVEYQLHVIPEVNLPDAVVRRGQIRAMYEMFKKIGELSKAP